MKRTRIHYKGKNPLAATHELTFGECRITRHRGRGYHYFIVTKPGAWAKVDRLSSAVYWLTHV